ncbi:MAG: hypothetical protein MK179_10530 [Pirellulaceae bacterium]|nr:hypothetical protein [Pirellulaceae bacterium]
MHCLRGRTFHFACLIFLIAVRTVGAPHAAWGANTKSAYPPENDSLAGLRAALTPVVTPGKTIVIEGPPSDLRDTETENSVDSIKERFVRMMDDALLVHFKQIDGIGISGGCERLYDFSMFHRCRLATAYLSGMFRPAWYDLYHWKTTGGQQGVDRDTFNEVFYKNFQWADLVLVSIQRGVNIRLATMAYDAASDKQGLVVEMMPTIRHYTDRISVGGDDRDGDGRNLSHEYDIADYTEFLANSWKQ